MFQGILLFAVFGLVLVVAYVALIGRRKDYEADESDADRLSDEDFRRIEFGDEDI
ncbi:hypothetical protein BH10ACT3_BH10ACT3_12130 [soil metagenome]